MRLLRTSPHKAGSTEALFYYSLVHEFMLTKNHDLSIEPAMAFFILKKKKKKKASCTKSISVKILRVRYKEKVSKPSYKAKKKSSLPPKLLPKSTLSQARPLCYCPKLEHLGYQQKRCWAVALNRATKLVRHPFFFTAPFQVIWRYPNLSYSHNSA